MNDRLDNVGYAASAVALFALIALAAGDFMQQPGPAAPTQAQRVAPPPLQQLERVTIVGQRPAPLLARDDRDPPVVVR